MAGFCFSEIISIMSAIAQFFGGGGGGKEEEVLHRNAKSSSHSNAIQMAMKCYVTGEAQMGHGYSRRMTDAIR